MKRSQKLLSLILALCFVFALLPLSARSAGAVTETGPEAYDDIIAMLAAGPYTEGEAVVCYESAAFPLGFAAPSACAGAVITELTAGDAAQRFALVRADGMSTKDILIALADDGRTLFAEPNYTFALSSAGTGAGSASSASYTASEIADLTYLQWGNSGENSVNTPYFAASGSNMEGKPVTVALLDAPVDFTHPDLAPVAYTFTPEQQAVLGCDAHGCNATIESADGRLAYWDGGVSHGTHCAGIIGAAWDGHGISGVASNVRIISIQHMTEDGRTSLVNVLRGYDFIDRANALGADIRVVNNSWLDIQSSRALDAAVTAIGEKWGTVSVFSAGNEGVDLYSYENTTSSLVSNPYAVIVAATDMFGNIASFSTYGKRSVALGAPGAAILSCVHTSEPNYLPGAVPGTDLFYDSFEDETSPTRIVQLSADGSDILSEAVLSQASAMEGGHAANIRLDRGSYSYYADGWREYHIFLDLGRVPEARPGDYLGIGFYIPGSGGFIRQCSWPGISEDFTDTDNTGGTNGCGWTTAWLTIPEDIDTEFKNISVILSVLTADTAEEIYFDCIGIGTQTVPYAYLDGTSMAAPFVSGAAAVLFSENRELDGAELAGLVRSHVRRTDALKDFTVTGGIFDFNALITPEQPQSAAPHSLYETALPLDTGTGKPFAFDAPGDRETRGPMVCIGEKLYRLPAVTMVEREPAYKTLLSYDTAAQTWQTLPDMPLWLDGVSAAENNGKLYVKGSVMDIEPHSGAPMHNDSGEVKVFSYDPAATSWSEASSAGAQSGQTLLSAEGSLVLVGGGGFTWYPETGEYDVTPGVLQDYDPGAGAGEIRQTLTTYRLNPSAAYSGGLVWLYDTDIYEFELVADSGAVVIPDALPELFEAEKAAAAYDQNLEKSIRDGVLLSYDGGVILVGPLSADGSADTWIMKTGSARFEPFHKKASDDKLLSPSACADGGKLYVIAAPSGSGQPFFRSTELDGFTGSVFRYAHDPRLNPAAMRDIVPDPSAIYGFRPSETGTLKQYTAFDWSDPAVVAQGRDERIAYHQSIASMYALLDEMLAAGKSSEEIALVISPMRNQIRLEACTSEEELRIAKERNLERYGHEEGPLPDELYAQYGSWETVIEKAFSTNAGMDACLGLYDYCYDLYVAAGLIEGEEEAPAPREYVIAAFIDALGAAETASVGKPLESFSDASAASSFYLAEIDQAVESGLVSGYPDGTLRPLSPMTRAEALSLVCRFLPSLEAVREPIVFPDLPDWAKSDIDRLSAAGLINGYPDGRLGADDPITVEQVSVLLSRVSG